MRMRAFIYQIHPWTLGSLCLTCLDKPDNPDHIGSDYHAHAHTQAIMITTSFGNS